jgi:hypothetical protein
MTLDHGYSVDADRRCSATTKKQQQCSQPPLTGISKCALHAGLARPRKDPHYGDAQALADYRRRTEGTSAGRTAGRRS